MSVWPFPGGSGSENLGPHVCMKRTSLMKLSPQPQVDPFHWVCMETLAGNKYVVRTEH